MAIGLYFFIVVPFNKMKKESPPPTAPSLTITEQTLVEIRDLLARK